MAQDTTRTIVIVFGIAAVLWGVYHFWPDEERRVRRRLDALAGVINEQPTDGLALVTRTAELADFAEHDIVLDPGRGAGEIHGRERLLALASRAPGAGGAFNVGFIDVSVDVTGRAATVHMTATLTWTDARGERNVDAREVELQLRKSDAWRVARVTAIDPLERPQS